MPIDLKMWQGGVGVTEICHGELAGQDFFESNKRLIDSPEQFRSLRCALIDLERVESSAITLFDAQYIAAQDKQMVAILPKDFVLAIIAPTEFHFGLARMWEALAVETGWEIKVFRIRGDGVAWIQQRLKEKYDLDLACV